MNPSATITVVLVGSRIGASAPTCDPAINLDAAGVGAALTRYERERSEDALAALPMHPDAKPVRFRVTPLSAAAWRVAAEMDNPARRVHTLVALACHEYTDETGVLREAKTFGEVRAQTKSVALAPDEWVDHLHETFGEDALVEIAKVVTDRTEAGPRAVAPFRLPRGLMLAR